MKKKTAADRYKRSPRQLTRDITLAIEMQSDDVLGHLRLRTEDGEFIDGHDVTPDFIKKLRADGRNPMWYLRRTWLEETFGRRPEGEAVPNESDPVADESHPPLEGEPAAANLELVEMLKESIHELKQDKVHLKQQLSIKDNQIQETTERWKESNVLTQNLHKRIEAMEGQMKLLVTPGTSDDDKLAPEIIDSPPVNRKSVEKGSRRTTKPKRPSKKGKAKKKTKRKASKPAAPQKPQWYETPTFHHWASRLRRR